MKMKGLFAIAVVGMGFACILLPQPSLADSARSILQDLDPLRSNDPLAPNSNEIDNTGLFNIIHQLNRGGTNWNSEEQNQQLNDAANAFKEKQQRLLQQQPQQRQAQPGFQVTTPQSSK